MSLLLLSGCWESEHDCFSRLLEEEAKLPYAQHLSVAIDLSNIINNTDLNVCDYTVLGGRVVKID